MQQLVARGNTSEIGLLSVGSNGQPSDGESTQPVFSVDARLVAFACSAPSLTGVSTREIMVRDRRTSTLSRVSAQAPDGSRLRLDKSDPDLSGNGRFVSFRLGARGGAGRVFRRDRTLGQTLEATGTLQGKTINGGSVPRLSNDGSKVVFSTVIDGVSQVVLFDFNTSSFDLISRSTSGGFANADSGFPSVSGDGRFVVFSSRATDLIAGGTRGTYLRDRVAGSTTRLAVNQGLVNSEISPDGRFIVASAPNARPAVIDQINQTIDLIPIGVGLVGRVDLSNDGRILSFLSDRADIVPNDLNGKVDVFVRNLATGQTSRVNVSDDGTAVIGGAEQSADSLPALSGNGRRVAFASADSKLVPNNLNTNLDVYSANVPTNGRVYSVGLVATSQRVLCFDGLTGVQLASFEPHFTSGAVPDDLRLDVAADRLYILQGSKVHVIDRVSTLVQDSTIAPRTLSLPGLNPKCMEIDFMRRKLYLGRFGETLVWDNLDTLDGDLTQIPHRTITTSTTSLNVQDLRLDVRRDELYISRASSIEQEVAVVGSASTANGLTVPVRRLQGANPFTGLLSDYSVLFDTSRGGQAGEANDAALVVIDRDSSMATFLSNGSRTGVLGDVPADQLVVRNQNLPTTHAVFDPLTNRTLSLGLMDLTFFNAGSTSSTPDLRVPLLSPVLNGVAVDYTR